MARTKKRSSAGGKKCSKGKSCGGSCIARSKKCKGGNAKKRKPAKRRGIRGTVKPKRSANNRRVSRGGRTARLRA